MDSILKPTISGTNEQFSALRDSDDAANTFVAFVAFNNNVTPVLKDKDGNMQLVPCADVVDITESDYIPSGMTAMRDGVNTMIDFLSGEAKKSDDVLVVVISDGMENASNCPPRSRSCRMRAGTLPISGPTKTLHRSPQIWVFTPEICCHSMPPQRAPLT
jgi:hypothetical protein